MELRDYVRVMRRSWIAIAVFSLVGLLMGGAYSVIAKPTYTAQTELFVATQSSGTVQELQTGSTFIQARVSSYVKTVSTPTVLQPAIDSLGLDMTVGTLAEKINATSDLKTVLIAISVEDESPVRAAAIAKAVASSLIDAVETLEKPTSGGPSPVRVSVITPASAPESPSSASLTLLLGMGFLGGAVGGCIYAVLRNLLDTRIRSERDLRQSTAAPILASIAFVPEAKDKPLITDGSSHSNRAESFRQLRTNLQFTHAHKNSKTILVTSSMPGEGKSSTATNLAISMAEAGQRVVLVDADLRRPTVAKVLGLEGQAGLTTALIGGAETHALLQPWGVNDLHVLTSGQIPPNPSELLGSSAMKALITSLEASFDAVIIDAPPLLPVTDAVVLSQIVGGVILVVGCHAARRPEVEKSLQNLNFIEADIFGVVLNQIPLSGPDSYSYSNYGYDSELVKSKPNQVDMLARNRETDLYSPPEQSEIYVRDRRDRSSRRT